MRDIKFRIYFKDEEPFMTEPISLEDLLHEDWIEFENKEGTLSLPLKDFRFFYSKNENYEIMQYTGLKDKNGREIYEGDIVTGTDYPFIDEGKQNYVGIVVFYDDAASFGYEYQCIRRDKRGISNGINNEFEANENLICENLEVIGNIYDNKNLLEEGE